MAHPKDIAIEFVVNAADYAAVVLIDFDGRIEARGNAEMTDVAVVLRKLADDLDKRAST